MLLLVQMLIVHFVFVTFVQIIVPLICMIMQAFFTFACWKFGAKSRGAKCNAINQWSEILNILHGHQLVKTRAKHNMLELIGSTRMHIQLLLPIWLLRTLLWRQVRLDFVLHLVRDMSNVAKYFQMWCIDLTSTKRLCKVT